MTLTSISADRKRYFSGVLLAFGGAICFSLKAIQIKLAYRYHVDALALLTLRLLFALPFYVGIALYSNKRGSEQVRLTGGDWFGTAFFGMSGYYLASLLDFMGLQYVTAGLERLVLFVYPTIVLLLSAIFLKKRIQGVQYLALALTYLGMAIAFGEDVRRGGQKDLWLGTGLIFGSAVTYAVYMIGSGRLIPKLGTVRFTCYSMLFATLGICLHFAFSRGIDSILHLEGQVYVYAFQIAIVSTVVPSFMISEGIQRIGSNNVSIIGTIGPIATIVMAYYFLGEGVHFYQIVGTIMVIGGVMLVGLKGKS